MTQEPLISISEASLTLGVSEAALRQWTDEGKIKAFVTPGGHRRYSRVELRKFISTHHKVLGIKDLVAGLESSAHQHREIAKMSLGHTTWYHQIGAESQSQLADLGRRLLKLIIRYVNEPSKRQEILEMIIGIGRDFGTVLAELGLPPVVCLGPWLALMVLIAVALDAVYHDRLLSHEEKRLLVEGWMQYRDRLRSFGLGPRSVGSSE